MGILQQVIQQFRLNVLSISSVPESYSSTVYKLLLNNQQQVFVKIPYSKTKLMREYEFLQILQDKLNTPRVIDFWEGNDLIPGALLLEAIDGEICTKTIDKALAYEIGLSHAKLHSIPATFFKKSDTIERYQPEEWRAFIQQKFEYFSEHTKAILSKELFDKSIHYFEKYFYSLPTPDGPCLIHMDFRPGNILVKDNNVKGIIDFESARLGSTENDFTKINRDIWCRQPNTKEPYIQGYNSVRPMINLQKILPFYTFYDAFCSIGWSEIREAKKHQEFIKENLEILKKVL